LIMTQQIAMLAETQKIAAPDEDQPELRHG
jgi:hypothetical protein